ncbi:S-layer homology domain-containing protein, partial [Candidatus Gracilibacteria bacterium]|nr:S-layer homology domain-containing protein [Candidatus Gracilibacteria bacterium]
MSAVAILFSIVTPVAGVNAAYSSSLDAANKLASVGVIVDQSANPADYRLGDNISRRELVKIAVLLSSAELNTAYAGKFSDVPSTDWAWKYAETAVDEGMIAANATFAPARNVTKAEALKMVMNATDVEKVGSDSVWAKNYVDGGVAAGIVETFSDYDTAAQRGWI